MTTLGINDLISADEGETGDLPSLLAAPPLELPPGPADFTGTDKLKKNDNYTIVPKLSAYFFLQVDQICQTAA